MRSTMLLLATAFALAGCSMMPSFVGGGDADKPVASATPAPANTNTINLAATAEPQVYEIQHTTRGLVRRVKVLLNGRTIDTLNMSKGRTESTSHCCTEDGCEQMDTVKACSAFKMTCDKDGACLRTDVNKASGKL